jgi:parallel beta-helix repeat protein
MNKIAKRIFVMLASAAFTTATAETIVVSNTNPSGPGSLAAAILAANADPAYSEITCNLPGSGIQKIQTGGFPVITAPVSIDGSIPSGPVTIENNAINLPGIDIAFDFSNIPGSNFVTAVKGFTIKNFVYGVRIANCEQTYANNNFFVDNYGIDIKIEGGRYIGAGRNVHSAPLSNNTVGIHANGTYSLHLMGNIMTNESMVLLNITQGQVGYAAPYSPNEFTNSPGAAMTIVGSTGLVVFSNKFYNCATGIDASGVSNIIKRNTFTSTVGYDIKLNGSQNYVWANTIYGFTGTFSGIQDNNSAYNRIYMNSVIGGSIEVNNGNTISVDQNSVTEDPQGFTAHGAITLNNSWACKVYSNMLHHNGGNGIYLYQSSLNFISGNYIYENGRVGIAITDGLSNNISQNVIYNNHASIYGGRTGIYLANANYNKVAPVITSVVRNGNIITVSGTTSTSGDSVEIFQSDINSVNSNLEQNAVKYLSGVAATGLNWTVTFNTSSFTGSDVYFIATGKDGSKNTSSFSNAKGVSLTQRLATLEEVETVQAGPNPFTETTTIVLGGESNETAQVYVTNLSGLEVYRAENVQADQSLTLGHDLKQGVYQVKVVYSSGTTKINKLVKN